MDSRPYLSKRSSFSNFSAYRGPSSPRFGVPTPSNSEMGYGGYGGHERMMTSPDGVQHRQNALDNAGQAYGFATNAQAPRYTRTNRAAYFESHWPLYACDWTNSPRAPNQGLVAVGTFSEDQNNKIQILHANRTSPDMVDYTLVADTPLAYPTTKLAWEPAAAVQPRSSISRLMSTSDCLRLWEYDSDSNKLQQRVALINIDSLPPITSFDWNKTDPSLAITSSIDTTCTIWDISTSTARTQLIAHDSGVNDVAYVANSVEIFASVGEDGSVRVFDLRSLDHSTIIYEPPNPVPLLRIATNPHDRNILATLAQGSNKIYVVDIRVPGVPVAVLEGHERPVNCFQWAPASGSQRRSLLASGSDDCQVLVWDMSSVGSIASGAPASGTAGSTTNTTTERYGPVLSFTESLEANNLTWNPTGDWVGTVAGRGLQGVRLA